jgi:xylulokinase
MDHVLGIDTSTTATKAVVIDREGRTVAEGVSEYGYDIPRPGWTEQDPASWWTATIASIRSALAAAELRGDDIAAVGLTGQMHGLVLLDRDREVIRPAILWNDQRTAAQCDDIRRRVGPAGSSR